MMVDIVSSRKSFKPCQYCDGMGLKVTLHACVEPLVPNVFEVQCDPDMKWFFIIILSTGLAFFEDF